MCFISRTWALEILPPRALCCLSPHTEQRRRTVVRFINIGGELALQARLKQGWEHIYRVIPYPRYDGEYEITDSWLCSF